MRLKLRRSGPENTKSAKMEPLTEGIIPSQRRPYGFFTRMSDEELVGYANEVIKERRIKWKGELLEADNGLYLALKRRMLLDEVDVESSNKNDRDWTAKSDEKLVTFAKRFIAKRGIRKRSGLEKADGGLFGVLKKRKLLDEIGLPAGNGGYREWAGMGTDELVAHAKRLITDKGITGRGELSKMDGGIYWVLRRRKLLDKIGLMDLRGEPRDWAKRNDAQLVADAKGFISVKGITGRKELEKVDCGLYAALRKRELLDDIGLEKKIRGWDG